MAVYEVEAMSTTQQREVEAERALALHMQFGSSHLLTNALKYPKFLTQAQHPDFQRRSFTTRRDYCSHKKWKEKALKRDLTDMLPKGREEHKVRQTFPSRHRFDVEYWENTCKGEGVYCDSFVLCLTM
jgi:hypothetical protein